MVISKSIVTKLPVATGEVDKKGQQIMKLLSLSPAYGCCLIFDSEEEAVKLGAMGPFEEIDIGNDFSNDPGLKLVH